MKMLGKQDSLFAATTFFAKTHPGECGSNGLPLTPNSIAILGRAQRLKTIRHPNLCQYLDVIRGKHERMIVITEYSGKTLEGAVKQNSLSNNVIERIFYQALLALQELHNQQIVIHNLEPKHILLDNWSNVKIFNYGLYYMTNYGEYVTFPIGNIKYMAPEHLITGNKAMNIKTDVWSLGMIMAELVLHCTLWPNLKISSICRKLLSFCHQATNVFERIAREHDALDIYQNLNKNLRSTIEKCLTIKVSDRMLPHELLSSEIFAEGNTNEYQIISGEKSAALLLRMPLEQIYYWWQLAGGDVQADLKKEGLIRSEAPILALPYILCLNGTIAGPKRSQSYLMDDRVVPLKLQNLLERLKSLPPLAYYPLVHCKKFPYNFGQGMDQLPLVIREKDTEYQFYRVRLFSTLLKGYPYTAAMIRQQAAIDIPPLLRGQIWACLLDVIPNGSYEKIDKFTPTSTDRQIEVDIPRCHQYDELLSSPEGHRKLKRLLKAWVTAHPYYVYWQGLDSLTAPFLYLNFNDEELAFLSVYNFIPRYLQKFFLKDNSIVIKEYLNKFSQLTAYHEPILAQHLANINFIPELYAIPWFLTMFSHVFPLHKILHLWDRLMLGDNSYPLYIGIAILKQLKSTLLASGFNECILLFSDLPDIVMETCVMESQKMYDATPKSIAQRSQVVPKEKLGPFDISDDIPITVLQNEMSPRISANDLTYLLDNESDKIFIFDIRNISEYNRVHLKHSINLPFNTLQLMNCNNKSLDEILNVTQLQDKLHNKIIICISNIHENCVEFSKFLVEYGVARVCMLHQGFNILHSIEPNILISN